MTSRAAFLRASAGLGVAGMAAETWLIGLRWGSRCDVNGVACCWRVSLHGKHYEGGFR